MRNIFYFCITLAFMAETAEAAAPKAEFSWPPALAAKLDHIIEVQRHARAKYSPGPPGYAPASTLREDFDRSLQEVGTLPELQALLSVLTNIEYTDLRAKFALMAADFARSKPEYNVIGGIYVYEPSPAEVKLAIAKAWEASPRLPGLLPPGSPVAPQTFRSPSPKPEHMHEHYRLALEYYLLAPNNRPHKIGSWGRVRQILGQIGHPATALTYIELSSTCPGNIQENDYFLMDQVVWGLSEFPSMPTLDALSELTEREKAFQQATLAYIGGTWGTYYLDAETFERDARNYQKWQAVVAGLPKDGKNPRRESLAKSIAALPLPPKRPASVEGIEGRSRTLPSGR